MASHAYGYAVTRIGFDDMLREIESCIKTDQHPTLFDANVPDRLRAAATELERRIIAEKVEPRTCGCCGSYIHECECN